MSRSSGRIAARARGWFRSRRRARVPAAAGDPELHVLERRIVWIFSSPRAGSSWLLRLLAGAASGATAIDEPRLGAHLALLGAGPERLNEDLAANPSYLFSRRFEPAWRPALRRFALERIRAEVLDGGDPGGPVLIKEPNGSQGADLIAAALPASRLIHLIRDPGDVIDSLLDAASEGGWLAAAAGAGDRHGFIEREAALWAHRHDAIVRAAERAGAGGALETRYEALRTDTASELGRICRWVTGAGPDPRAIAAVVEREAFERVPAAERGPGHAVRAAEPGLWKRNLGEAERDLVERLLGGRRRALGYR